MTVPGSGHVDMSGVDASLSGDFLPRVGVRLDVAYLRSGNVLGSGHHNDALTYLGGPALYLARTRRMLVLNSILFFSETRRCLRKSVFNIGQTGIYARENLELR